MSTQRSSRKLINDRLDRCLNCHDDSVRRLEEIQGFYSEGEEANPTRYIHLMAMVDELIKAEKVLAEAYQAFRDCGKP